MPLFRKSGKNVAKKKTLECKVGNRNDEERGTHICLFSDITEVTLGNGQKK
jgi:hypothetical protein